MKVFGFEVQRISNKRETPREVQTGKFTITMQSRVIRARTMKDYLEGIQKAESVYDPLRYIIYNLYRESIDFVPHLAALINLRLLSLSTKQIQYIDAQGNVVESMQAWLDSPGFKRFVTDILETKFWGFSLFDFAKKPGKWFDYDLVPRKHVDPIRQVVYQYETGGTGIPYNDNAHAKYVMPVGDRTDLGLLKQATPIAIHLRNMTGDMMNYVELAGNNFMVTKTKNNDPRVKNQLVNAMKSIGSGGHIDLPEGVTELDIESLSSSQQNELFTEIHDLLNKELSKLILGSTMGIEDGSSLSQAEVHERTMGKIFASDDAYVLDVLNYQFSDYLELWNIPTGGTFEIVSNVQKDALATVLGVGGTQALQNVLIDPVLTLEQKRQIAIIIFGLNESDADKITETGVKPTQQTNDKTQNQ